MTARTVTNATRVLDGKGAAYELVEYAAQDFTAEEAVEKLGLPATDVFKTLVVKGDRTGPLAAVVPTDARLSSKKLARVSGNRTVTMVAVEEMERLTGYVKGGCSPFGMKKTLPLFVDASAAGKPRLYCSAGQRGVQLVLSGETLVAAAEAKTADLVED
ncbi:MAG TPA: aminoacyl-tRNA deacylase [Thermoanaerobaculia bacterium]|nr:aminoacyl-tRNA deacylase [Thermoanaerobaculia bacterium]